MPQTDPKTPAQFSVAISDFKMNDDGTMSVFGPVTSESIDAVNDIVDADWAAKALGDWLTGKNFGNLRAQHQESWPVGRGIALEREGTVHKLKALVVDPLAQKLIQHRVLKAFSIGIVGTKRTWDTVKSAWRVIGGHLEEVTICDVPCNSDTEFVVLKADSQGAVKSLDLFSRIDPKVLGSVLTSDELITLASKFHLDETHPGVREAIASQKAMECETCEGSGKTGDGDCPDCGNETKKAGEVADENEDVKAEDDEKAKPAPDQSEEDGEDVPTDGEDPKDEEKDGKANVLPEDVTKSIDDALSRLHTATCPTFTTEAVEKMDPGTWAERLDISALESKLAEHTAKTREEGPSEAWNALTGVVGKLAGPVIVTRHVSEDILSDAHTQMVGEQRAQKAATIADAVGTKPGTEGPNGGLAARQFYTNQAAARHADQLKAIHDQLVGLRPDICPLPSMPMAAAPMASAPWNTDGSGAPGGSPVNGSVTNKSAVPLIDAGGAAVADVPVFVIPEGSNPADAEIEKKAEVDINEVVTAMAAQFEDRYTAKTAELIATHETQMKSMQEQINQLQSQPNPMEAPLRKALLQFAPERTVVNSSEQDERVAILRRFAEDTSNPERQMDAQKALFNLEHKE